MPETTTVGATFAQALADKDREALVGLLAPDIDVRAQTPNRTWEASGVDAAFDIFFGHWFEDDDRIVSVEKIDTDAFADRERVGYRFRVENADGVHLVEQQAFLEVHDGRITWMRTVCSGYRPV